MMWENSINDRWEDAIYSLAAERGEPLHIVARRYVNDLARRVEAWEKLASDRGKEHRNRPLPPLPRGSGWSR